MKVLQIFAFQTRSHPHSKQSFKMQDTYDIYEYDIWTQTYFPLAGQSFIDIIQGEH